MVDGKLVTLAGERRPGSSSTSRAGVVTTLSDPEGRPTVAGYLEGVEQRAFPWAGWTTTPRARCCFTDDGGAGTPAHCTRASRCRAPIWPR